LRLRLRFRLGVTEQVTEAGSFLLLNLDLNLNLL